MIQRIKGGASLALASVFSTLCMSALAQDFMDRPVNPGGTRPRLMVLSGTDKDFFHKVMKGSLTEIEISRLAESQGTSDNAKRIARKMIEDHTEIERKLRDLAQSKNWNWEDEWKWREENVRLSMSSDDAMRWGRRSYMTTTNSQNNGSNGNNGTNSQTTTPASGSMNSGSDPTSLLDPRRDPTVIMFSNLRGADYDSAYLNHLEDSHKRTLRAFRDAANYSDDPEVRNFAQRYLPTIRSHYNMIRDTREGR